MVNFRKRKKKLKVVDHRKYLRNLQRKLSDKKIKLPSLSGDRNSFVS